MSGLKHGSLHEIQIKRKSDFFFLSQKRGWFILQVQKSETGQAR